MYMCVFVARARADGLCFPSPGLLPCAGGIVREVWTLRSARRLKRNLSIAIAVTEQEEESVEDILNNDAFHAVQASSAAQSHTSTPTSTSTSTSTMNRTPRG
jgi:hypothetical protein